MNCPTDATTLELAERHGIEIDYCPTCRGVWLDRGELDKIIERVDSTPERRDRTGDPGRDRADHHDRDDRYDRYDDDYDDERVAHGTGRRKRKRGGILGELFEFGG